MTEVRCVRTQTCCHDMLTCIYSRLIDITSYLLFKTAITPGDDKYCNCRCPLMWDFAYRLPHCMLTFRPSHNTGNSFKHIFSSILCQALQQMFLFCGIHTSLPLFSLLSWPPSEPTSSAYQYPMGTDR